jgi:hypothetical protein
MNKSAYWDYLSEYQKDLVREGSFIFKEIFEDSQYSFKDYSFIVFPYAKAYEGFLKKFLLDSGLIDENQYNSSNMRLGMLLCPDIPDGRSIYLQIKSKYDIGIADEMWETWKVCRNEVFHYYPHNNKSLKLDDAKNRVHKILLTIENCYRNLKDSDTTHTKK